MNKEQALLILEKYSPMPNEECMTEEMLNEYAESIDYFSEHPDTVCIKPIMMTFSLSESYGIHDHAVAVLESFSNDQVVPQLIEIIQSENEGKRYWGTQIAKSFPDERLVDSLSSCINDPNEEIRAYSIYALHCIGNKKILPLLQERLAIEEDEEVLEELNEAISSFT
ncbi:HEAT repeat domain-containing protein [Domibacillus sp. DTU_2020_1001157_1_SI_ALB_TIR_016]|uniref:HEAT repeat domain-containing protein n=1 Tax=Domibacillus sp. DTU_2020_1001157_1_SI_ALB_TIR_016 TaxID=3077789 RepID=UPI0028E7DCDB|nr:HEAT repeat domain-containing protein [Domibacillus sp. DTU_2020_1001157_1_SI_ALB_TIR_016]WNS80197.1 HEAT repeat domain-containing protein [Domibacillus sp. DTU_2020_1001157_1_SI_ALB_TIR_016]